MPKGDSTCTCTFLAARVQFPPTACLTLLGLHLSGATREYPLPDDTCGQALSRHRPKVTAKSLFLETCKVAGKDPVLPLS
ncbi:hypothetical protein CFAM422_001344 [Trichoderma lentiforme]|uniref:Uncharacterized protein n=1 Tax=Trichoderma lentiforme TaxID=1567552 RepID=A0A9P5CGI1_9HYPO|nr:hypothetical protein CFAM422_001344 [Trichoderma lentiforme]